MAPRLERLCAQDVALPPPPHPTTRHRSGRWWCHTTRSPPLPAREPVISQEVLVAAACHLDGSRRATAVPSQRQCVGIPPDRPLDLTVVAAMRGLPRRCHVSSQRQPLGSCCEAAIVGGQSRPPAPWPSCPGTRAGHCRPCTTGDRGSEPAQPANERVSGCHVSTKRLPPVAFQRRTGRADG